MQTNSNDVHGTAFRWDHILIASFVLALIIAFCLMIKGWGGSLIEYHGFRQTQTAISVAYMVKGSNLLQYQTPVLGPPWSIPFEFPSYQLIVFLFVKLTGIGIDQSGRIVSMLFFMSLFYPVYKLICPYFKDERQALIPLILLCISPQYIYWSRTFMIESTALSLSVWYVYLIRKYMDDDSISIINVVLIILIGALASVTKVTTFFVYYIIGIFITLQNVFAKKIITKKTILLVVVAFIVPVITIVVWTSYSDGIKSLSAFGANLTSKNLSKWNFGTYNQKISIDVWKKIIGRSAYDLFGHYIIFLALVLLLPFCSKKALKPIAVLAMLYVVPFIVFTNLFFAHSYYVYANGVLLLMAVGIMLGDFGSRGRRGQIVCILIMVSISCASYRCYVKRFLNVQGTSNRFDAIKLNIDKYTGVSDLMVCYGADWSSEMPYYLDRRALMLSECQLNSSRYLSAKSSLANYNVGAVAVCNESRGKDEITRTLIADFFGSAQVTQKKFDKCDFYFRENKT